MLDDLVFFTLSVTLCDNEYDLNNVYKFIISQYLYYFNFYTNKNRVKIIKYTSNLFMFSVYTKVLNNIHESNKYIFRYIEVYLLLNQ